MSELRKFRVKGGGDFIKVERSGDSLSVKKTTVFRKGQVVDSTEDLCEKYPNKFEEVHADSRSSNPATKTMKVPTLVEKLVPKVIDETEGEEDEKILPMAVEPEDQADPEVPAGEAPEPEGHHEESHEGLGKDVTDQFKKAVRADLKVFKKGKVYNVADADEPDAALEDGAKLKDKKDVDKFIGRYLRTPSGE